MLKPQANPARDLVSLNGLWNFALSTSTNPEAEEAWKTPISPKLQAPVPASYNDIFADEAIRDHIGWVYYQRQVTVPRGWSKDRVFLRIDAATHRGRVYVNEEFVTEHVGGYTPFEAELTHLVAAGQRFRLTIAVSNELNWDTIPPGRIEMLPNGKRKQHYQHDFFNYSGLARSVWLYSVPTVFIEDVTVRTDLVDGNTGVIDYDVQTSQPVAGTKCTATLVDENNKVVGEAVGQKGRLSVDSVVPWQPGAAYLYELHVDLLQEDDGLLDRYELPVGVRSIKVRGNQFLINDNPFYFTGFGKHEDSPIRGKGHDDVHMVHDFRLMSWMGANSFRTSHYPYAQEVLEYADRHGIVVIDETPAVGLNLAIVSGIHGGPPIPTFSPDTIGAETQKAHAQAIRELIARDKNHPSVVMWAVTNEPASHEDGAREYMEPLVALNRELDPTRPVCFANEIRGTPETDKIADLFDVLCFNRYYGWYLHTGDLATAEEKLEEELLVWEKKYGKPMMMTEYGVDTVAGLHAVCDVAWSEEFQCRYLEMYHRVFDRVSSMVGEQVWNFADFQTSSMIFRVDGNKKGVFTRDRRPKSAAHVLRQRWRGPKSLANTFFTEP